MVFQRGRLTLRSIVRTARYLATMTQLVGDRGVPGDHRSERGNGDGCLPTRPQVDHLPQTQVAAEFSLGQSRTSRCQSKFRSTQLELGSIQPSPTLQSSAPLV